MRRPKLAFVLGLAVALALFPADAKKKKAPKLPELKRWIDGPIRYIAKKDEAEAFRALKTDDERILYVEKFWARRDPHPETMTNEYRQLFWERVREANELFLDSASEGWHTDRGKIHILYGPPTEIQDEMEYRADDPRSTGGIIRWIYEGRPGGRLDVNPITVVAFERRRGGEYKVSYDPKLTSVFFNPRAMQDEGSDPVERWMDVVGMPGRTEMSVMLDLGRMQEVPPQAQLLLERVETREAYVTHEVQARVDRFGHPEHGSDWLVSLTVDVSYTAGRDNPAVIARFRPLSEVELNDGSSRSQRVLDENVFKMNEEDGRRFAQARIVLPPGDYELTILVADPDTAKTGLLRRELKLGPLTDRFRFSDVVLAEDLESLRYRALSSYDEPYTIGPFRVVPRFSSHYRPGDTIQLFYEVYQAALPLEVSYQVQGREEDGRWVDLGLAARAPQEHHSQAWSLPTTEKWPLGEYRVRVEVSDASGKLISTDVPFELTAEAQSVEESSERDK
ncbi:MAG: GWxTD domain-containing protein [Acidobacteria bacterium]|nr:GWxTD domain-containing protein [Acidobacteriota bacterium]NIM60529.1 GWxTD domain-containing protein [Acidobacteriota bacterium]NIO59500.1 GWxTD domain-containing protein [Acidobacteriota bacterium]NIQ30529.1 GWxTD domain-containing protein [Acidobacteriota bacterium]NIQ85477.1 GWxTD domain-containing protein [Acidobacteriota bacterium]